MCILLYFSLVICIICFHIFRKIIMLLFDIAKTIVSRFICKAWRSLLTTILWEKLLLLPISTILLRIYYISVRIYYLNYYYDIHYIIFCYLEIYFNHILYNIIVIFANYENYHWDCYDITITIIIINTAMITNF